MLLASCTPAVKHPVMPARKIVPAQKDPVQPTLLLNDSLDEIASIISGVSVGSKLFPRVTTGSAYKKFSVAFNERWLKFDSSRLRQLQNFRVQELDSILVASRKLLYPFSGPDILYPLNFFHRPDTFILFGLEPVGQLPDLRRMDDDSLQSFFSRLNNSLNAILDYSFFRTQSMSNDLRNEQLNGVTSILFLFLKRLGYGISGFSMLAVDSSGALMYRRIPEVGMVPVNGIQLSFTDGKRVRTLFYFPMNAADHAIGKNHTVFRYLSRLDSFVTYLKGASYLMHKNTFSSIRSFILSRSVQVIQDDSGIPLSAFLRMKDQWSFTLFGKYNRPINMFAGRYQASLDSLYKTIGSTDLRFGIGYNYKDNNSNLMIATKRRAL
jgi:hypothetical protein